MLPLETLYKSWFFELIHLNAWEFLFREWDIDPYIYIVYDGELVVERQNTLHRSQTKVLWNIPLGDIVWESSLKNRDIKKSADVRAIRNTALLKIHVDMIEQMFQESPEIAFVFLTSIIHISHFRLEKANREITIHHEVNLAIAEISEITLESLCDLLEKIRLLLWVEQIMYIEKNIVMENYFKLHYSSLVWNMNMIIEFEWAELDIKKIQQEGIKVLTKTLHVPLQIWENLMGYIVIANRSQDFRENDEKLLYDIALSLVGIIKQKEIIREEKDKALARSDV